MLVSSMSTPLSQRGQCELASIHKNNLDISYLEAHVLQEDSRRSLIVDRQPWTYPQSIDAEILLERLAKLDPSVAEAFTPKSKALNGLVFRLVNESDPFQDERSYIAMSYCWKKIHYSPPLTHASVLGFYLLDGSVRWNSFHYLRLLPCFRRFLERGKMSMRDCGLTRSASISMMRVKSSLYRCNGYHLQERPHCCRCPGLH